MKKIILFLALSFVLFRADAQRKIAVQSGNSTTFYSALDTALQNAVNGDIIYVPGGVYSVPSLLINKSLQIFGAGHYPDSTMATGQTILNGEVRIVSGADNGSLSGFYINGNVYFGTTAGDMQVNNYGISRNSMNSLYLGFDGSATNTSSNILISENVIKGDCFGGFNQNVVYLKNIVAARLINHNTSVFRNNVFLLPGAGCGYIFLNGVNSSTFANNILCNADGPCGVQFFSASDGNVFHHNLFRGPVNYYFPNSANVQYANFFGFANNASDVFNGGTAYSFSYGEDYHLLSSSPAHNGGDDGTDVGIYGTNDPYKPSAVPANPHIRSKTIAGSTDAQGNLNVQISVGAQEK